MRQRKKKKIFKRYPTKKAKKNIHSRACEKLFKKKTKKKILFFVSECEKENELVSGIR